MSSAETPVQGITILGSTGSVGVNTLDVVARHPQRFRVTALTANSCVEALADQCRQFRPCYAVMSDPDAATRLQKQLASSAPEVRVLSGPEGLIEVASLPETDVVMAAIVGAAGLLPALQAARSGKRLLLANKEALVMSGALFMQTVRDHKAVLLPIDSEHNAILQCLPDDYRAGATPPAVRQITLTASGGPFRTLALDKLAGVTPEQACKHPKWNMGRKISVDSATMMNKGLELIEAGWLFDVAPEKINVLVHPQSLVHSLVEYMDGSVLAQLGNPDMRVPISHALGWPERIASGAAGLDLVAAGGLEFDIPDADRYPSLGLAIQASQQGGTTAAILNAANEVAVESFLAGAIAFTAITQVIEHTLGCCTQHAADSLETILEDDAAARVVASDYIHASGKVMAR